MKLELLPLPMTYLEKSEHAVGFFDSKASDSYYQRINQL